MDGSEKSQETTNKDREFLLGIAERLAKAEDAVAKYELAYQQLMSVLLEKTYIVTNKITGEKEVTDLDTIFSVMIQHFKHHTTLDKLFDDLKVEKLKPETAAVLYGNLSKQQQR